MLNDVLVAAVSVVIGVVASYGLYWLLGKAVSLLPSRISQKAQVWAFVTPAVVLLLVVIFKSSSALTAAYGIAVTATMITTSIMAFSP